ncbi:MAG: class I SAM-dependent methyltransferase [Chloroflexi bacterium]|nr:class I SAM-dependent methyltransferase [Chloroflexota bacterium]
MANPLDSTTRFSSRVENYVKYRPTYPSAVIEILAEHCQLTADSVIADVGSGTGLLTELFLKHGNQVFGVEPNREMREAGERLLSAYANFTSVDGTAEATTLPAQRVDFVTAGQAFHWFDGAKTRQEFKRILKPQGWVALVWNVRQTEATPFMREYEQLVHHYAIDMENTSQEYRVNNTVLAAFYGLGGYQQVNSAYQQVFDFAGVKGRLLSSSYMPDVGHPLYTAMLASLATLFEAHQVNGAVAIEYETRVYFGHLS